MAIGTLPSAPCPLSLPHEAPHFAVSWLSAVGWVWLVGWLRSSRCFPINYRKCAAGRWDTPTWHRFSQMHNNFWQQHGVHDSDSLMPPSAYTWESFDYLSVYVCVFVHGAYAQCVRHLNDCFAFCLLNARLCPPPLWVCVCWLQLLQVIYNLLYALLAFELWLMRPKHIGNWNSNATIWQTYARIIYVYTYLLATLIESTAKASSGSGSGNNSCMPKPFRQLKCQAVCLAFLGVKF